MKNKLAFHADKMKLVCILYAVSIVVNICAWCAFVIASDYSYIIDDDYFSHLNYLNLVFTSLTSSTFEFIPFAICVLMLIYNKIKHNVKVLLKIYAYAMAAFNLLLLIFRFPKWSTVAEFFMSAFLFILLQIIYIIGFIVMGINDKWFDISRTGVIFAAGLRVVLSVITAVTTAVSAKNTAGQLYQLHKFISYYYAGRCVYSIISAAALAVLLFCVFTRDKLSIEDAIASLNQDYTSGKITKDSYDTQREELLKKL